MKKEINNLENAMEKLKGKAQELQSKIDSTSADEGWTVLAELTEKMDNINEEVDEKEMRWLEVAEELSVLEEEEAAMSNN